MEQPYSVEPRGIWGDDEDFELGLDSVPDAAYEFDVDECQEPESDDPFRAMIAVAPDEAEALRSEWGADFDDNIALARSVAGAFADSDLIAVFEENGLGNDPRVVRVAAAIGRALNVTRFATGDVTTEQRSDIEARLRALSRRDDYWDAATQDEVRRLYLKLYGPEPLPMHRSTGNSGGTF